MFNKFRKSVAKFITTGLNSMSLSNQFLRMGGKGMLGGWAEVRMTDSDVYSGYGYAAFTKRARKVASVATKDLRTDSRLKSTRGKTIQHPYLETISKSKTFSNYSFWETISTYLDLEGVYYLMAVRTVNKGNFDIDRKVGKVMEFKLLNPYNIRRILTPDGLDVAGYVETRKGYTREFPKEMIIEIKDLNPFDEDKPYSIADATKDSQYTLKTASDYTKHALKNNINAPGILATDVQLPKEEFENFLSNIRKRVKGEPIFANGGKSIKWESMQMDLNKAALKDVNESGRDNLLAVTGMSKTMMGIEQSGTTRETANVQTELFMEGQVLPRIQLIIDALNQDYKNNYPQEYKVSEANIVVENPMESDHESELKEAEAKTAEFDLYTSLLDKGYKPELAAKYVEGQITIEDLGKPTLKPKAIETPTNDVKKKTNNDVEVGKGLVQQQQGSLQNAIVNIEEQLVAYTINKVEAKKVKNDITDYGKLFDSESNFIPQTKKNELENELELILVGFYGIIMTLQGSRSMNDRAGEFGLVGTFSLDKIVKKYIDVISQKVSESHIDTISNELYETARKAALKGLSQEQIVQELKTKYDEMVDGRAAVIARTETNRAFTKAQFEADRQFIEQNELEGRVYKQWRTRSNNPCEFCKALENEGLIPFGTNFRDLGDIVSVGKGKDRKVLKVDFESLGAGNAHPNCSCIYELIIKN